VPVPAVCSTNLTTTKVAGSDIGMLAKLAKLAKLNQRQAREKYHSAV
jgi:hypothetical protein